MIYQNILIKNVYEKLALKDIEIAADLMLSVCGKMNSLDGYVSIEVSPKVANHINGTIEKAKRLHKKYIESIKTNKIALKVKLADLEDNMDIKRIAHPKFKDYARLAEYLKYYNDLKKIL